MNCVRAGRATRMWLAVASALVLAAGSAGGQTTVPEDADRILSIEHFVTVRSTAPGMEGDFAQIHVRERVRAGSALRSPDGSRRVVLFVHGAGTPAEVAFDSPQDDYSWMAYLAKAGFDTFSMNVTGYGRSSRPPAMNDPCNLSQQQRQALGNLPWDRLACAAPDSLPVATIASDWNDIDAVVEYLRSIRGVDRVSLIAWSQGGPRSGGYTALHPQKVERLVLLSPAYNRNMSPSQPASLAGGAPMNTQSRAEFVANWDRQVGCANQYDPAAVDLVWREMMGSDMVGATWGTGVRRAPRTPTWGWNSEVVARTTTPVLMIAPAHDAQVAPARVNELYEDLGSSDKVLIDLACTSHNAHWESNRALLYQASLDWLTLGTINGKRQGIERVGY